jgi:hypothetical protein
MKKLFTFLMVALTATVMMAQWQPSDTEATRLDAEGSMGQTQMKTLRTDDGKIVLSWLRGERVAGEFSYQLHLQIFDAEGNAMFGDEGIIVCDKRTRTWTTDYALALASNGDILLGYTDIRNDPNEENAESYLYRYTQQGNPVWGADGILFPSEKIHENAFIVEDVAPVICVSGDNIYAGVNHTEYYMEEANENNWQPSPWFPNQQMPDSVQVNESVWLVVALNDDGTVKNEAPMSVVSRILSMNAAPGGNVYMVYNNETLGLDAQLINPELANQWENVVTVEERPLTGGMYMPTPLTDVNENDVLMLSYEVPTDWYGYQVVNHLTPEGTTASEALSLAGGIDGDAGSAAMGVKENRAFVAWEYAYSSSEYRMNVNVVDDFNNYFWIGDKTYGVTLETNDSWGYKPVKVIPVEEAWVVLYGNCTSWNGANFMVVKMDEFGEVIWTKQICEDNFKSNGLAVTYDENYAYIFYTQDAEYDDNWNEIPGTGGMFVMCVLIGDEVPSAINEVQTSTRANTVEIFTIDGRQVNELQPGVNIVRTTDENGVVTTKKVLN